MRYYIVTYWNIQERLIERAILAARPANLVSLVISCGGKRLHAVREA